MRARRVAASSWAAARAELRGARKDRVRLTEPRQRELLNVPQPTAAPSVWLLTTGWRRWGPLAFDKLASRA